MKSLTMQNTVYFNQAMNHCLSFTRNSRIPRTLRRKIGKHLKLVSEETFRMNMFGQDYEGQTGNYIDDRIYIYGMYEPATVQLLRLILKSKKEAGQHCTYVDIGTNVGMHLTALADIIDTGYGFEPWQPVREKAKNNLAINEIKHINIFDFGLSDKSAELPYQIPKNNNYGMGSFIVDQSNKDVSSITLPIKVGDFIFKKNNIQPSAIKIDVEGYEKKVLVGLKNTITNFKPAIIFEFNEPTRREFNKKENMQGLFGKDYFFYGIVRGRENPKLVPFNLQKKYENILAITDNDLRALISMNKKTKGSLSFKY